MQLCENNWLGLWCKTLMRRINKNGNGQFWELAFLRHSLDTFYFIFSDTETDHSFNMASSFIWLWVSAWLEWTVWPEQAENENIASSISANAKGKLLPLLAIKKAPQVKHSHFILMPTLICYKDQTATMQHAFQSLLCFFLSIFLSAQHKLLRHGASSSADCCSCN